MIRTVFTLLLLIGISSFGFWMGAKWGDPKEPEQILVEKTSPSVVSSMRALARLEGAEFHMERIVDLREKQTRLRGLVEAEDALLLVAVGNVVAGVDLGQVIDADVVESQDHRTVKLRLPAPEVFSASLDSSRTYVHSRKTDMLAERKEDLETKARARAESTLQSAAIEAGILTKAQESVRRSTTALLLSLGFDQVEIEFQEAPAAPSSF